jgi:hypothetical protein
VTIQNGRTSGLATFCESASESTCVWDLRNGLWREQQQHLAGVLQDGVEFVDGRREEERQRSNQKHNEPGLVANTVIPRSANQEGERDLQQLLKTLTDQTCAHGSAEFLAVIEKGVTADGVVQAQPLIHVVHDEFKILPALIFKPHLAQHFVAKGSRCAT